MSVDECSNSVSKARGGVPGALTGESSLITRTGLGEGGEPEAVLPELPLGNSGFGPAQN